MTCTSRDLQRYIYELTYLPAQGNMYNMLYNYNNYTHHCSNVQGRSVRFARGGLTSETIPQIYTPAPGRPLPSLFPKKLIFYRTDNVSRFRSTFHSFSPYFIILNKVGLHDSFGPALDLQKIFCAHNGNYIPQFFPSCSPHLR